MVGSFIVIPLFQHTAARRRLGLNNSRLLLFRMFQHTAARRRLEEAHAAYQSYLKVSTHSRPKAAGRPFGQGHVLHDRFNTQPPEGGWAQSRRFFRPGTVSTHSRPKAAGASLKSLAPSGFAAPISLGSQEKREREYNTAFSVTPEFAIS